jgi:hypothetical protein
VGGADNPVEIPPFSMQNQSNLYGFDNQGFNKEGDMKMSDAKKPFTRPKVPDGHAFHVTTRQKEITPGKFFVGYETTWEPHQKEVPYQTPKKP